MSWTFDDSDEIPELPKKLSLYALADARGAKFNKKDAVKSSAKEKPNTEEEDDSDEGSTEEGSEASEAAEEEEFWVPEPSVEEKGTLRSY